MLSLERNCNVTRWNGLRCFKIKLGEKKQPILLHMILKPWGFLWQSDLVLALGFGVVKLLWNLRKW